MGGSIPVLTLRIPKAQAIPAFHAVNARGELPGFSETVVGIRCADSGDRGDRSGAVIALGVAVAAAGDRIRAGHPVCSDAQGRMVTRSIEHVLGKSCSAPLGIALTGAEGEGEYMEVLLGR